MFDRVVFYILALCGLFEAAMALSGGRILISMAAAFAGGLLTKRFADLIKRRCRGRSKRRRLDYARWMLDQWLLLDEAAQREKIDDLLLKHGIGNGARELFSVPVKSEALNAEKVLDVWKKHRGEERVALTAFCPASSGAVEWAQKLENPSVRLIDGHRLAAFIAQDCPVVPEDWLKNEKRRISLKTCGARILSKVKPAKCGFYALVMLGLYLLRGHSSDLLLFALLAVMSAAAFRRKRPSV